jgi:electron transfer flavoprotein alpha subunit
MATSVLAFAETRGGEIRKIAYEAVSVARALADAAGGEVHAVVAGAAGIAGKAGALGGAGR